MKQNKLDWELGELHRTLIDASECVGAQNGGKGWLGTIFVGCVVADDNEIDLEEEVFCMALRPT